MSDIAAVKAALEGLAIEDNPQIVRQKSRDFFWYSPVLKRQLDEVTADIVVNATSEADVIRVLKACYAHDVPVTTRGAGTGNYGQAMPLSGGVVLNLAEMNKVLEVARGSVRAEAGAIMSAIDAAAHESGQELRMHPSTHRTAAIPRRSPRRPSAPPPRSAGSTSCSRSWRRSPRSTTGSSAATRSGSRTEGRSVRRARLPANPGCSTSAVADGGPGDRLSGSRDTAAAGRAEPSPPVRVQPLGRQLSRTLGTPLATSPARSFRDARLAARCSTREPEQNPAAR